jgi:hypothetical protein
MTMELGIFTRTFSGTLDEALTAIAGHGLSCSHLRSVQFASIPSKYGSPEQHVSEFRRHFNRFLEGVVQ